MRAEEGGGLSCSEASLAASWNAYISVGVRPLRSKGWLLFPTLRYLDGPHMADVPRSWTGTRAATPLPAWRADFGDAAFDGPFPAAVRAAYAAHGWLQKSKASFSW